MVRFWGNCLMMRGARGAFVAAALVLSGCTLNTSGSGLLVDVDRHAVRSAIAETVGTTPAELQQAFDETPEVEHFNAVRVTHRLAERDGLSSDMAMRNYLQSMVTKLTRSIDTEGRDYSVVLLQNDRINAYTPGAGKIIVNEGLLAYCQTEGQVAAVLAHEVAHVVMRHPQRVRQLSLMSRVSQRFVDSITPVGLKDSMAPALKRKSLSVINGEMRDQEMMADSIGIDLMVAAGYDPKEMVGVLRQLSRYVPDLPRAVNVVSGNHPLSDERETAAFEKIRHSYPTVRGTVNTRIFARLVKPYHERRWAAVAPLEPAQAVPTASN